MAFQPDLHGGRLAANTSRTPIESDGLVRERKSIAALTTAGDFFVDDEVGLIFLFVAGGAALPAAFSGSDLTYYIFNGTAADGSDQTTADHRFIHCLSLIHI